MLAKDDFDDEVNMWVFEEVVDGRNLTEIINTDHENVKYLPVRSGTPGPLCAAQLPRVAASAGWDPATGVGTPNFAAMLKAL